MRVAIFLPSQHLGDWSWPDFADGRVPASGTDGQALALAHRLSGRDRVAVLPIFHGRLPHLAPEGSVATPALADAVAVAGRWNADVIIFLDRANDETRAGVKACDERGLRAIVWAQNGPYRQDHRLYANSAAVRRVICVSHPHADLLRHTPLFRKVDVINNSLTFVPRTADRPRAAAAICFLGATVKEKGFHHVAKAWGSIRQSHPDATLAVLGSARLYDRDQPLGPLGLGSPEFEREFLSPLWGRDRSSMLAHGVHIAGLQSPVELLEELQRYAIAIVNPSVNRRGSFETFCVSAIEAQAAGCAVVGGHRVGLTETIQDGETGVLIRRQKDLASAVNNLIGNPQRAVDLGKRGAEWAPARFSAAAADERWLNVIDAVVCDKRGTPPRLQLRYITPKTAVREVLRTAAATRRALGARQGNASDTQRTGR